MRKQFFLTFLCLTLAAVFFLSGCGEEIPARFDWSKIQEAVVDQEVIVIGQVPSRAIIQQLQERLLFKEKLSKKLDREIQFRFASSYQEIVEDMKTNKYDMVILGPLAYVEAAEATDYQPLVRPVRFGSPSYRSIIFTHQNSNINTVSELKNKTIAFVDPDSASGYLFPLAEMIQEHGINPAKDLEKISFLGGHDRVVEAVYKEQFVAGSAYEGARTLVLEPENLDELPVLARSRPIPSEPTVISPDLRADEEIYGKLQNFFLNLHKSPEGREVLDSFGDNIDKLIPAEDSDYDEVRTVYHTLNKYEVKLP
jgi:phosphonate transport system substrate-binding protein